MNTYDIDEAVHRHARHPVLGRASRFLVAWRDLVDSKSDGWSSWAGGPKAAKQLMELIQKGGAPAEAALRKAIGPIKACCTRQGWTCPELEKA